MADFWGPNKRKECTILINKSKQHDERFDSMLVINIIQPILDCIITGKSIANLLKKSKRHEGKKHDCHECNKTFNSQRYLKVHIAKIHTEK